MNPRVREAYRAAQEELVRIPAWDADRVRDYLKNAVETKDVKELNREGHLWSGTIALRLFDLADAIKESMACDSESENS